MNKTDLKVGTFNLNYPINKIKFWWKWFKFFT